MSLTVNSRVVAKVSISRVLLLPTLGGFELLFGIDGESTTDDGSYFWLVASAAQISVGAEQGNYSRLGTARPDFPVRIRTYKTPNTVMSEFKILLAAPQLEAIEELRAGGDLRFQLGVSGEGGSESLPGAVYPFHDSLWVSLGRSDWIQQLHAARAVDTLLLEIPMPFVAPSKEHRVVVEALRQAQRLFMEGHYCDCVINCRKAIEALASLQHRGRDWPSEALQRLTATRNTMTKNERQLALEASLFHFASLAAHDGAAEIDRRDAKFAITIAASVVANSVS